MGLVFEGKEYTSGEGTSLFERLTQNPQGICFIMLTPRKEGGIVIVEHSATRGRALTMDVPPGGTAVIPYRDRTGRPMRVTGK